MSLSPMAADAMRSALQLLPIRAPASDRDFLVRGRLPSDLLETRQRLDELFPFAVQARHDLLRLALSWSGQYVSDERLERFSEETRALPAVLSGHQPELFHPGVWFKNFFLHGLAQRMGRVAINLIVDNDQQNRNWLSFPVEESGKTIVRRENFDYGGIGLPYEERQVNAAKLFEDFVSRVQHRVPPFVNAGILPKFWEQVLSSSQSVVGYRFATARHRLEWEHGLTNLEVPLSQVCQTEGFYQFAFRVLERGQEFFQHYNEVLTEYREVNGLSGADRPVPNLERVGEWLEMPFWIWSESYPQRQRLFVRSGIEGPEIASERGITHGATSGLKPVRVLSHSALGKLDDWKLRTRALTTTMFSRSILSDCFLHGIGGAIYDQIGDEVFRRFWGVPLPDYLTATATFRLPGPHRSVSEERLLDAKAKLRDMRWKPEKFLEENAAAEGLVAEKQKLLANIPSQNKRSWQERIEDVNQQLRAMLRPAIQKQQSDTVQLSNDLHSRAIEMNREWSFVLYPTTLPGELLSLAEEALARFFRSADRKQAIDVQRKDTSRLSG